ncbi:MAG: hypothetical protein KC503_12445 [Myxococcales bacterium]|nr:hypothetical protein [Myxococcales bacterium]
MKRVDADDPRDVYSQRRARIAADVAALERDDARIANVRLVVFAVALAIAIARWGFSALHAAWLAAPALVFVALMIVHERTLRRLARARAALAYYDAGLRRLDGTWRGEGTPGAVSLADVDDDHPFAADLDPFGEGSLFQRLCRARTRAGEKMLARWLATPDTDDDDVGERLADRQRAIDPLRGALDLRERLALVGSTLRAGVEPERLTGWGSAPQLPITAKRTATLALLLPTLLGPLALGLLMAGLSPLWPLADCLTKAVLDWSNGEAQDDATLIIVERAGP